MNPVVRVAATMAVAVAAMLVPTGALAVDSGDIVIVSLKGEVFVSMSGTARTVRAGSVLDPPAILRTGRDGSVELRQGATTLSVGPETVLEFPALEKRGAPIDRIVQPRGNVFYNIGKREGRKLRIETPYLVGVVKGTQFNVAAQDDTTTISLFEGLLEVRAADESGVVDLRAGEIASRRHDDKGVSVIKMDGVKAPAAPSRQPPGSGSINGAPTAAPSHTISRPQDPDSMLVDSSAASVNLGADVATVVEAASVDASFTASVNGPAVEVATTATADAGNMVSVSAPTNEVSTPIIVDAAPAAVDTGAAVSASSPTVDVSTTTTVDAGPASVDTGASVGVSASADAGPPTTDPGVDAEARSNSGHGRFTVVVGASNNQHEVTVGSANAADAVSNSGHGNGNSGPGVDVTVDLGADLGLDVTATTPATDTTTTDSPGHGPPADVVDRLDGLLRHRAKK
jgi:hypothetical protein